MVELRPLRPGPLFRRQRGVLFVAGQQFAQFGGRRDGGLGGRADDRGEHRRREHSEHAHRPAVHHGWPSPSAIALSARRLADGIARRVAAARPVTADEPSASSPRKQAAKAMFHLRIDDR